MKSKRLLPLLLVAVLTGIAISIWAADSTTPTSGKVTAWEHLVFEREGNVVSSDRDLAATINRLGNEGWEMFTVTPVQQDGATKRLQFYFKRPKS